MSKVKVTDHGLNKLISNLKSTANSVKGAAGIFGDGIGGTRHPGSDLTTVQLMAVHEFGAPTVGIPKRSVVEATADKLTKDLLNILKGGIKRELSGQKGSVDRAVREGSSLMRNAMEERVRNPSTPQPENAEETVKRKGFNNPLYHTGTLAERFETRFKKGR